MQLNVLRDQKKKSEKKRIWKNTHTHIKMPPHNQLGSTGSIQNQLPIRKAQIHNSVKKPKVCPYNTI